MSGTVAAMTDDPPVAPTRLARWRWAWTAAVWAMAWVLMIDLQSHIGLAQVAITLVLASALAAIWLPLVSSLATTAVAVLAFDWFFVPPKYTLLVDMTEDLLLLLEIVILSWSSRGCWRAVACWRAERDAAHATLSRCVH